MQKHFQLQAGTRNSELTDLKSDIKQRPVEATVQARNSESIDPGLVQQLMDSAGAKSHRRGYFRSQHYFIKLHAFPVRGSAPCHTYFSSDRLFCLQRQFHSTILPLRTTSSMTVRFIGSQPSVLLTSRFIFLLDCIPGSSFPSVDASSGCFSAPIAAASTGFCRAPRFSPCC